MNSYKGAFPGFTLLLALIFQGCSPILAQKAQKALTPAVATATPQPVFKSTVTPGIRLVSGAELSSKQPGEPAGEPQVIHDQSSASTAAQNRAFGGDEYSLGRFERPFGKQMDYIPGLDLIRADMNRPGDNWIYFTILLEGAPIPEPALYGIELDNNIDGRGDLLIQVNAPSSTTWAENGIKTWWDSDGDVGGKVIVRSDSPVYRGSGFETLKIDASNGREPGKVWSRLSTNSDRMLQIAVSEELVGGKTGKFSWKPFTDGVPFPPSQYDINDYFPLAQAGSALIGERDYPLKAVYGIDNTCRRLSGLAPSGREQGVCPP